MTPALVATLMLAASDGGVPHHVHVHPAPEAGDAPSAPSTDSIYQIDAPWLNAGGKKVQLKSFAGTPVVLAMIYTSCQAVCPMLVSDVQRIERALGPAAGKKVRFVLVSFDPARDTPRRLAEYARIRTLAAPRWTLLTGNEDDVRQLAAVIGMRYRPDGKGDFAHSNLITVLDAKGVVRHQVVGLGQDPTPAVEVLNGLPGGGP